MSLISFAAVLAVSFQFISWYGLFAQIRFTNSRRTTAGLSLVEAECRIWGKLPWLLFASSLPVVDWTVLATNTVSIALAGGALWQFLCYTKPTHDVVGRVLLQFVLLVVTVLVCAGSREFLEAQGSVWSILPVAVTIAALSLGSISQFRENLRRQSTSALSLTRYLTLVASYVLWFSYGYLKGVLVGWDGAWTICACTGLGLVASCAVLAQFFVYRAPQARVPFLRLPAHEPVQSV